MEQTGIRGASMAAEIAEQPQALQRLLDDGRHQVRAVAAVIAARQPRFVLIAARGTSDHAALYAKYLIETKLGLPVGLASPSTLTVYRAHPDYRDVLWLSVSQSGGSPDLVESAISARRCGALTVALTNVVPSPLTAASEHGVAILAGPETAVAATKSYTSELLALYLLITAWAGGDGTAANQIPEYAQRVLDRGDAAQIAPHFRAIDRLVLTGRGFSYPTAREAALKLMETSYLAAHAFSSADLMHGPLAMIDAKHPVVAVVSHGVGGAAMLPALQRLAERGATVTIVGDWTAAPSAAHRIWLPSEVGESLSPILQILPLQQLAWEMAIARGYDPDAPRGLRKVTETL